MAAKFRIRTFDSADLIALHGIREAAFAPVFQSFRDIVGPDLAATALTDLEQEQAILLDQICGEDSSHEVLIAEREGEAVGFCSLKFDHSSEVGEIDLNAVHPDHQGVGIGTALYEAALSRMQLAGMKAATVGTGGDPSHAPARAAYRKAGFRYGIPSIYLYRAL